MEELKSFDEIHERDPRHHNFVVPAEDFRKISLIDIYRNVADIKLHEGVPEKVRSHFEMARNLLVYSWFHYPFHMAAWLYALISVEYALRERIGRNDMKFKDMLKRAVKEKLIKVKGFSHIQTRIKNIKELGEEFFGPIEGAMFKNYCDSLCESIPLFRNEMAHGSTMLFPGTSHQVRICAEFINQLFEEPTK
jgi:hypothetical protein